MLRLLRFLLWAFIGFILLVFALSNREQVAVGLFPFQSEIAAPLFIPLFIAFILGIGFAWLFLLSFRYRAFRDHQRDGKRIRELEAELASLKAHEVETQHD